MPGRVSQVPDSILLVYHTLYQWPVWGRELRTAARRPPGPRKGGGGGRQSLCSRGGRARMTGLTGGRAHLAAGSHDVIPSESVTGARE